VEAAQHKATVGSNPTLSADCVVTALGHEGTRCRLLLQQLRRLQILPLLLLQQLRRLQIPPLLLLQQLRLRRTLPLPQILRLRLPRILPLLRSAVAGTVAVAVAAAVAVPVTVTVAVPVTGTVAVAVPVTGTVTAAVPVASVTRRYDDANRCPNRRFSDCACLSAHLPRQRTSSESRVTAFRWHAGRASGWHAQSEKLLDFGTLTGSRRNGTAAR
jgi:hypothetical protein